MSDDPFDKLDVLMQEHGCAPSENFCSIKQEDLVEIMQHTHEPATAKNWYVFSADSTDGYVRAVLWHENELEFVEIPYSEFKPTGDGTAPDFNDLEVIDWGHGLRLGKYEAAADALGEYVKKLKERRERMEGVQVSEEYVAKQLGFVNVKAYREWLHVSEKKLEDKVEWLISAVCNLKQHTAFKDLWEQEFDEMERRRENKNGV